MSKRSQREERRKEEGYRGKAAGVGYTDIIGQM